jgi:LysM repeat protein
MKKILFWSGILALMLAVAPRVSAQDSATQQQLDQLSGQIQTLQDGLTEQDKRISALEKKISDMQDKLNSPSGNDYASSDDLKKLAEQVQEIDKKREDDNQKILDALGKLGKGGGVEPTRHESQATPPPNTDPNTATAAAGQQQNGYYYTIQAGNTLSAIAKAYRAQGIKVTATQILAANPGLSANSLYVGKKIFIPAPQ